MTDKAKVRNLFFFGVQAWIWKKKDRWGEWVGRHLTKLVISHLHVDHALSKGQGRCRGGGCQPDGWYWYTITTKDQLLGRWRWSMVGIQFPINTLLGLLPGQIKSNFRLFMPTISFWPNQICDCIQTALQKINRPYWANEFLDLSRIGCRGYSKRICYSAQEIGLT